MVYTNIIYIALSYERTLYTKIIYSSYFTSSLNISIGKTPVFNSSVLFTPLSTNKKPYYNSSLSLNKGINLTSIGS